jgi:hypothetical protein
MKFDKFDPEEFKSAVNLGMYGSDFPTDLTEEYIFDGIEWLNSPDGKEYVSKAYAWWKSKAAEKPDPVDVKIDLKFVQTVQWNEECGFWFDSVTLKIVHSYGEFTKLGGEVSMKKTHNRTGRFQADLSQIPSDAHIQEAYLIMRLNRDEGIANADRTGVFEIRNGKGVAIKEVRADWINRNYQKYSNPNVRIDLTEYIRGRFNQ